MKCSARFADDPQRQISRLPSDALARYRSPAARSRHRPVASSGSKIERTLHRSGPMVLGCLNNSWQTPGVSELPMLLGITKWLAWVVEPPIGSSDESRNDGSSLSTVPIERLRELGLRLRESTPLSGDDHQLLR